ncbi:unnamed protein product [Closterium sp. Naga37s-1]|nr:unnamed protein product [Closterium sp. Naga37s-1]
MLGYVQGQGATTSAQESAAGHSGLAAVASASAPSQPVAAPCVTTAAAGQPGVAEGSLPAAAAQPGAPAGALLSAQGAAAGVPAAAAGPRGAAASVPTTASVHPGAAAVAPTTAVVQPRNDTWDIGGPHTDLTTFHPGVLVQGAVRSEAAYETARAAVVQTGSSAWSSGEQFFAPSAFPSAMHFQGAQPPCAVGYAPHAGGVQPVDSTAAVPSGPIGHALQPPNVLYLGSGQQHASVQLPFSSHRPLVHDSTALLVSDEALDNVSGQRGHTSASRGRALSSMLSGFVQGSQLVLPSPAASTSMPPSTQGGEIGEEATSQGFTGVTKKQGKDEWIARIVLDRSSQSLIVINNHFGSEVEAASVCNNVKIFLSVA